MRQAPPVCCADPRGPEHLPSLSPGLPSPPHTPPGSPGSSAGELAAPSPLARQAARAQPTGARGWAPSPRLPRLELVLVALAGVLLAALVTWPLLLHLPSRIAPDLGDPVRTAWEVAWVGHAMLNSPLHLFDANAFYPHPLSLAFSDSLLGYGPAAFFGSGTVAALVRYNLLFLFAWSLCFFGAYLLARELGLGRLGAGAAGIAFAYAPYRVTEAGHLHVISSGGLPLALFLLLRGYRRSSRRLVLAGWLVSAWQVSLGFTLGLQYCYLIAVLGLLAFVYWAGGRLRPGPGWAPNEPGGAPTRAPGRRSRSALVLARLRSRGALIPARLLLVSVIGVAALGLVAIYQARPYLQVSHDYPTAKRTIREVENYSSGPAALLAASSENRVWGPATAGMRAKVHSKNEDVFFPGGLILALALLGLAGVGGAVYTRNLRLGLALGAFTCSILAMGLGLTGAGYPYRLLYDHAPGWNGVRVPGRVFTLGTLFYALLAGAGLQALVRLLAPLARRRSLSAAPAVVGVVALIGLLGEGAGHLAHPVVPQPQKAEVGLPGPLLDLPTDGPADRVWQYFSTNGFYKIPVGNSTFDIPAVDDLRGGISGFPDRASVEKLRYYGIRTVVLHLKMPVLPGIHGYAIAEPQDLPAAAAKSVAGLGVTRRAVGSLVIYEIGPGPKALHGSD
jgi:hypothetical protein